ncbi:MAG: kinase/pyrophosphorylase, partial [Coriobacteriales bacterium]|nr:kinase/pyrophosphorylase [Coriobacteriales bacterium]
MDDLPVVYVVSDSLGDTAAAVALAAASQFPAGHCRIERLPKVRSVDEVDAFIDAHLTPEKPNMILFHTIASHELRAQVIYLCAKRGIF